MPFSQLLKEPHRRMFVPPDGQWKRVYTKLFVCVLSCAFCRAASRCVAIHLFSSAVLGLLAWAWICAEYVTRLILRMDWRFDLEKPSDEKKPLLFRCKQFALVMVMFIFIAWHIRHGGYKNL